MLLVDKQFNLFDRFYKEVQKNSNLFHQNLMLFIVNYYVDSHIL